MSLVNQMLQDLDRRQERQDMQPTLQRKWLAADDADTPWQDTLQRIPWITCTVLACSTAYFMWQEASRSPDNFYYLETASRTPAEIDQSPTVNSLDKLEESVTSSQTPAGTGYSAIDVVYVATEPSGSSLKPETTLPAKIGLPNLEPPLSPDSAAVNLAFAPSHGVSYPVDAPLNGPNRTTVEPAPLITSSIDPEDIRTTRLSGAAIRNAESMLQENTTPLNTESTLEDQFNLSITPAGSAADRSYRLARRHLDAWNTHAAVAELKRTLVFDPTHGAARELLGALLIQQGDLVAAEPLVDAGISLLPRYSPFSQLKARILAARGDVDNAIQALETVTPAAQHHFDHNTTLAALYQKHGDHDKAVSVYLSLIEYFPDKPSLWSGLAISLDAQGEYEAALKSYKQAVNDQALPPELRRYAQRRISALNKVIDDARGNQS